MDRKGQRTLKGSDRILAGPDMLPESAIASQTIDLDGIFTRDVTTSGSFDFRKIKNVTFGKLLEAMPVPTLLIDAGHCIVFANEAAKRMANDGDSLIGRTFSSLFPEAVDSKLALQELNRIFAHRRIGLFEALVEIDQKSFWCRLNLRSIRFRDSRLALSLVEDLTAERKQLVISKKYEQLVDVFPIGIGEFALPREMSWNRPVSELLLSLSEAKLVGGNSELARTCGAECIEDIRGVRMKKFFPLNEAYTEQLFSWLTDGCPVRSFEIKETGPDGVTRYFETTFVGNVKSRYVLGFWVMRQDVTHRKEAEETLRNARDMLEERVKERTVELSKMNQELRGQIAERERAEKNLSEMVEELQEALAKVKALSGLLPICSSCKKIRDDKGYWTQVEVYIRNHSEADFSHSICPDCAAKLYPEFYSGGAYK
ncbi:MAG: PAS domain-containing protein [Desulfomonilaceae bacterium]